MTTFWWVFLGACVWAILVLVVIGIFAAGTGAANAAMDQARENDGPEEL